MLSLLWLVIPLGWLLYDGITDWKRQSTEQEIRERNMSKMLKCLESQEYKDSPLASQNWKYN
jgi:hypothetical protein